MMSGAVGCVQASRKVRSCGGRAVEGRECGSPGFCRVPCVRGCTCARPASAARRACSTRAIGTPTAARSSSTRVTGVARCAQRTGARVRRGSTPAAAARGWAGARHHSTLEARQRGAAHALQAAQQHAGGDRQDGRGRPGRAVGAGAEAGAGAHGLAQQRGHAQRGRARRQPPGLGHLHGGWGRVWIGSGWPQPHTPRSGAPAATQQTDTGWMNAAVPCLTHV